MKFYSDAIRPASLAAALLLAAVGAAQADALSTPSLTGPLAADPSPMSFDAGPLGKIYVTGAVSGLALYQTNHTSVPGDHETLFDFSNAQVSIQKTDGMFQFYLQAGGYSLPSLGQPYVRASTETTATFGVVPVAYVKFVPTDSFSIEAGKLPTLIGAEYTFTFENLNIERGLLWNEEPAISRGVQANYTSGPLAISASWNDGAYTNRYNQISGSAAWTFSPADTVSVVGSGDLGSPRAPFAPNGGITTTYSPVNSEEVFNLIWTHTSGPWTITPYGQYTNVTSINYGCCHYPATSTWGGAVLANYAFDPNWSLGGRVEYIAQNSGPFSTLYGHSSSAWSFTVTPTYQYKVLFVRADLSYVTVSGGNDTYSSLGGVSGGDPGPGFGTNGTASNQFRALLEVGVIF